TGGRHRSVYFAEEIKNILEARSYQTTVEHRDVDLG
ncbi:MAG TPA: RNase adapter RapZ, partial [Fervidobacterium sp.]|nr:RNase adapter RapZ [Fervidobacterium sp.]